MPIEEKIKLLSSKKIATILSNYKIKVPEITQLINNIEKNENLKTKYYKELINIKKTINSIQRIQTNKKERNTKKSQRNAN